MESSLDQTDYDLLFKLLDPGSSSPESGFQRCRLKLIKFFSWRRCPDPSNLADETIVRLLKNVKEGQMTSSETPYKYVYAIAHNVYREHRREIEKHQLVSYDDAVGSWTLESSDDCRELCLKRLPNEKMELLNQYYLLDRQALADKLQLSLSGLRVKIHRIKEELRNCCDDCQKRSAS
jgi:DNA-directed RNA polymerase specialized sigma24 family protein